MCGRIFLKEIFIMNDSEIKKPVPPHADIIKDRDAALEILKSEIASNPEKEWRDFEIADGNTVKLPAQAIIESNALVQDASSHLELFRSGSQALRDHGEIVLNPRSLGFIMSGVTEDNKDWDGIRVRVALQRGATLCENKMKAMDYDDSKPGYKQASTVFNSAEQVLKTLES